MFVIIAVRFSGLIERVSNFVLAIPFPVNSLILNPNNVPDVFTRLLSFRIKDLFGGFEIFDALSLLSVAVQPVLSTVKTCFTFSPGNFNRIDDVFKLAPAVARKRRHVFGPEH
jgi:hypothetical protein